MCTDDKENSFDLEHLAQRRRKWLLTIAFFPCPVEGTQAILLADIEREEEPLRDAQGHLQYYCPTCHCITSVDKDRNVVPRGDAIP